MHQWLIPLSMVLEPKLFNKPEKGKVWDFWSRIEVQLWSNHDVSFNLLIYLILKLVYIYSFFILNQKDVCDPMVCMLDMLLYPLKADSSPASRPPPQFLCCYSEPVFGFFPAFIFFEILSFTKNTNLHIQPNRTQAKSH